MQNLAAVFLVLTGLSSARADVTLQSWTVSPWNATSGIASFSATVTDPGYLGGTAASFIFSSPKINVNVTNPSAPDFSGATTSFFGFETSGFGVGDSNLGRFTRGESFVLQSNHTFDLKQIIWREFTGDEVLYITWTSGGVLNDTVYNVTTATSVLAGNIIADPNTPVVITNVSASAANLSGRLRFQSIVVGLANDLAPVDPVPGSSLVLTSWTAAPFNAVNGGTSFSAAIVAPENGGTPATITFANPKTGVNVTTPGAPDFTAAAASFFGFESTGFGVGNSGLGRFERGESFTVQCIHNLQIDEISFAEYTGDEVLHLKWTQSGTVHQQVFNINSARFAFAGLQADANTPVVITNVSPTTANLSGRLRFGYIIGSLVFPTEPVYDASGADGFQQKFGVNLSGGEFAGSALYPLDPATWNYYNGKGLNVIRVPFKWERIQPTLNGAINTTSLDSAIALAHARGMKVLLDMHNYARYNGNLIGSTAVPLTAYKDVWRKLATHYAGETAIYAYGIMNEPNATGGTWPAAAQAGTDAIREVDSTHWIVVDGDGWSSASGWEANNPNLNVLDPQGKIIYDAHCYFAKSNNDQYLSYDAEGAYPNMGVVKVNGFLVWLKARGARGMIGEFGVPKNDARWNVVLDRFLAQLQANGLTGTYWSAGKYWNASYLLNVEPTSSYTVDAPQMSVLQDYGD